MLYNHSDPVYKVYKNYAGETCLELLENLIFHIEDATIVVPKGFVCDGASVPWIFHDFICPNIDPRTVAASFLHDFIYRTPTVKISRAIADLYFMRFCKLDGFPAIKANLAYLGVRLGGSSSYMERDLV